MKSVAPAKRATAPRWRIVGACAGAVCAVAVAAYAMLDERDGRVPMAVADQPNADAASPDIAAPAPGPRLGEPTRSGARVPARADASAQIGVFIDPDAQPEPDDALSVQIGEYIDADDDSPVHSDSGAVQHIGAPLDPDA